MRTKASRQSGTGQPIFARRRLIFGAFFGALTLSIASVHAQDYPTQTIRIVVPFAAGGTTEVVALGVTVKDRVPALPNVPTIADTLPGYEVGSWFGLVAPTGTPAPVIRKLAGALDDFLKQDSTRERIAKMGAIPDGGSPEKFSVLIKAEQGKFREIVKRANIRVE